MFTSRKHCRINLQRFSKNYSKIYSKFPQNYSSKFNFLKKLFKLFSKFATISSKFFPKLLHWNPIRLFFYYFLERDSNKNFILTKLTRDTIIINTFCQKKTNCRGRRGAEKRGAKSNFERRGALRFLHNTEFIISHRGNNWCESCQQKVVGDATKWGKID